MGTKQISFTGRIPMPPDVPIGMQGEHNAETLVINGLPTIDPNQIGYLNVVLPNGKGDAITIHDNQIVFSRDVTPLYGRVTAWVTIQVDDDVIWKSEKFGLIVSRIPNITEAMDKQYPEPLEEMLTKVDAALEASAHIEEAEPIIIAAKEATEDARDQTLAALPDILDAKDDAEAARDQAITAKDQAVSAKNSAEAAEVRILGIESDVLDAKEDAEDARDQAIAAKDISVDAKDKVLGMRAEATTLDPGSSATASYANGVLHLGIPKGENGESVDLGTFAPVENRNLGASQDYEAGDIFVLDEKFYCALYRIRIGSSFTPYNCEEVTAAEYFASKDELPDVPVKDVMVQGRSVIRADGTVRFFYAGENNSGFVKGYYDGGTQVVASGVREGSIMVLPSSSTEVKAGEHERKPIVPSTQHQAVFYGLAKAAGVDQKNSTLPFGTYSEQAKTAIRQMLGVDPGLEIYICSSSEYDHETGIPTIQNPDENVIYLVPDPNAETGNLYSEWIYKNNAWERIGGASIDLSEYAKKTDIPVAATVEETQEIIDNYGQEEDEDMLCETTWVHNSGSDPYFVSVDDATDIADAFKAGKGVTFHLPTGTGEGSPDVFGIKDDIYVRLLAYEPGYTDGYGQDRPESFMLAQSYIVTDSGASCVNMINSISVGQDGKLHFNIYID